MIMFETAPDGFVLKELGRCGLTIEWKASEDAGFILLPICDERGRPASDGRTDVVRVRGYANPGSSVTIHPFAPEQYKTLVHGQDRSGGRGPAPESRRKEST